MPKSRSKLNNPYRYQPGDCLVIPLFDDLFAVAWVAWASNDGEVLGHIYAPFSESELTVEHLTQRDWSTPLLICRFGDAGVIRGEWRVVPIPEHAKRAWAIPDRFSTVLEAIRWAHVVTTVPGHPDQVLSRRSATVEEAQQLPSEDLSGYRAVEIAVSMLITPIGASPRDPTSGDSNASIPESAFRKEPKKFRAWYPPGTVFALPLSGERWMRGIFRLRSAGMILANFVGPVLPTANLTWSDTDFRRPPVWIARVALGEWFYERVRLLSHLDQIPPESAATTAFRRTIWAYPSGRYDFRVSYDPLDLERELTCTRVDQADVADLFPDWRLGGLGVAQVLARL